MKRSATKSDGAFWLGRALSSNVAATVDLVQGRHCLIFNSCADVLGKLSLFSSSNILNKSDLCIFDLICYSVINPLSRRYD